MTMITRLESALVDQIAAGEVIERAASVVKELVENALDAGAHRIRVDIEGAGLRLIRVLDDGAGIAADELALALERHATSKICQASDLHRIRTLGFRGEALPSIAAVSRMRLSSRARGSASGAELSARGGRGAQVRPSPHPPGTRVEVRDLFFNTPARRKFLRSDVAEARAIASRISQFAVAHPEVHFEYRQEDRLMLDAPGAESLRERLAQVLGADAADHLIEVEESDPGGVTVRGLVSDAEGSRGNRSGQWLYVNRRLVRDRSLSHALQEATSAYIPKGRHAGAFLFITVAPGDVDVNVHPAKWEVRFARPQQVRSVVYRAVRGAALRTLAFSEAPLPRSTGERSATGEGARASSTGAHTGGWFVPRSEPPALSEPPASAAGAGAGSQIAADSSHDATARPLPLGSNAPERLVPLAQYRNSFIIATDGRDLLIVDQHVAHERILYERILREWEQGRPEAQPLLLPRPVSLSAEEMVTFEHVRGALAQAGFRIEPFGSREVILREAPVAAGSENVEALVRGLLEEGEEARRGQPLASLRERLAARCACHAAIKIHTPLNIEKMEFLLRELLRTRTPFLCPHGRPIVLRLADKALERAFRRC